MILDLPGTPNSQFLMDGWSNQAFLDVKDLVHHPTETACFFFKWMARNGSRFVINFMPGPNYANFVDGETYE